MNVLAVKGLTKRYPNFILEDITFSLQKGRIIGLIGKKRCREKYVLKSILNLVRRDEGSIEMFGKDFIKNEEFCKQNIGVVLGGIDFYNHKKIPQVTEVTKRFYSSWDEVAYQKYIEAFSLDPIKKVKELSTGMKVKYMIALALSHEAKLLILDEPTSGLDPVSRDDLLVLFRELVKSGEMSILFSTHITSDLEKCADDITYIKNGKLLRSAEKNAFIDSFQHLKEPGETEVLTLEEIMIRTERSHYDTRSFI